MPDHITTAIAREELLRLGFTPQGVSQVLGGQIVVNPSDRSKLADVVLVALGDTSVQAKRLDRSSPLIQG
jgi:hypothetical protein